jgi:hypothetical protein
MSWSEALLWGAVIVALLLGVLAAAYFMIQYSRLLNKMLDWSVPLRTVRTSFNLSSFWDRTPQPSCKLAHSEIRKLQIVAPPMIDKEAVRSGAR